MDTIVAKSTPEGIGAIGVIRLSGPDAWKITFQASNFKAGSKKPIPRRMEHAFIQEKDGSLIDEVMLAFFKGPNSYTGEDLVEIHCHGGEAVISALLKRLVEEGARPAQRGEFTRRAFENQKMDLSRAEAIIGIINASTREHVAGASRVLEGELKRNLDKVMDRIHACLAEVEARLEFFEEADIQELKEIHFEPTLSKLEELERDICRMPSSNIELVLCGKTNVGKSSLLNALAKKTVCIVTEEAGTTRDAVHTDLVLGGYPVRLVDTAGSEMEKPKSLARQQAQLVAKNKREGADVLLWVTDDPEEEPPLEKDKTMMGIYNKKDKFSQDQLERLEKKLFNKGFLVSAKTGAGLEALERGIAQKLVERYGPADGFPLTARQASAVARMSQAAKSALANIEEDRLELAAEDLRTAIQQGEEILGVNVSEDVLERIFSEFCIGK